MSKSPKLGLNLTPASESLKNFVVFRTELAGDASDSNMMILDTEVGAIKEQCEKISSQNFTWGMLKNGLNNSTS